MENNRKDRDLRKQERPGGSQGSKGSDKAGKKSNVSLDEHSRSEQLSTKRKGEDLDERLQTDRNLKK